MPSKPVNASAPPPADGRRGEILEAALALIAEQGFAAVTHRRVAARAGVPLGSTTYYFDSRDHLLRDAFRRFLSRLSTELGEAADALKREPSVERLLDFLVDLTEAEIHDVAVIVVEYELVLFAARDGSLADELHRWQDTLVGDLAEGLQALGAPDPAAAARAVVHLVRGYEFEQLTRGTPRSEDLRSRLRHVLASYLDA